MRQSRLFPNAPCLTILLSAILLAALSTGRASAAPEYFIQMGGSGNGGFSRSTPFAKDSTSGLYTSNGNGTLEAHCFAYPGQVGASTRCDATWGGGFSGGNYFSAYSRTRTTDCVISGPPGYVSGTLHCRVRGNLSRSGGFTNNNAHGAQIYVNVDATATGGYGSVYSGNFSTYSSGALSGHDSPNVDIPLSFTGTFLANSGFAISLLLEADAYTYGNINVSPGFSSANAASGGGIAPGLQLEEVGGQVMTLPAGYTFSSAAWGISNNHFTPNVAVEDPRLPASAGLDLASANPGAGEARLTLSLPRAAVARVALYDVAGRMLRVLADGWLQAGAHPVVWDGRTRDGVAAPAGLYFVRAESEGWSVTKRLARVR